MELGWSIIYSFLCFFPKTLFIIRQRRFVYSRAGYTDGNNDGWRDTQSVA